MADIVVGVDGSDGSRAALRWAVTEAARHGCDVQAVCGWSRGGSESAEQRAHLAEAARRVLHDEVTRETGILASAAAGTGAPVPTAVRIVERAVDQPGSEALLATGRDARMIVVGARGRGLLHRLRIGSVSASIAVHATAPVVVARGIPAPGRGLPAAGRGRPVAVGVDGSPNSLAALGWAAEEARLREVPLIAVHAWLAAIPLPFAEAPAQITQALEDQARCILNESIAGVAPARSAELDLRRVIVASSATQALLAEGNTCDLVVVGARGRGGFAELLLGSVSHQCMLHCAAPVAIIHGT